MYKRQVLEGGGMRGVFTCGVLDYMMDKKVWFPYGVGVSAGACNGLSYMSRPVSYTHLDVYKRQGCYHSTAFSGEPAFLTLIFYIIIQTGMIESGRDRKSTRLNSSHITRSRMPSSA